MDSWPLGHSWIRYALRVGVWYKGYLVHQLRILLVLCIALFEGYTYCDYMSLVFDSYNHRIE